MDGMIELEEFPLSPPRFPPRTKDLVIMSTYLGAYLSSHGPPECPIERFCLVEVIHPEIIKDTTTYSPAVVEAYYQSLLSSGGPSSSSSPCTGTLGTLGNLRVSTTDAGVSFELMIKKPSLLTLRKHRYSVDDPASAKEFVRQAIIAQQALINTFCEHVKDGTAYKDSIKAVFVNPVGLELVGSYMAFYRLAELDNALVGTATDLANSFKKSDGKLVKSQRNPVSTHLEVRWELLNHIELCIREDSCLVKFV